MFAFADDPNSDPNISGDPYKTLFVARLVSNTVFYIIFLDFLLKLIGLTNLNFFYLQNYETTESRIKREFEAYGPIKRVGFVKYPEKGLKVLTFSSVRSVVCGM